MTESHNKEKNEFDVIADPSRITPKFSSSVNFKKTKHGGVVMTFFAESPNAGEKTVIETIYVEEDHAKEIARLLREAAEYKEN